MAGQPKMRRLEKRITELPSGEDSVFERVADGEPMRAIAESLGISRPMLYLWIKRGGEEREEKYDMAREISADALVEDGLEILDAPLDFDDHSGEPTLRKSRAAYRQWLAAKRNRKRFGDEQAGVQINVGIAELHLDALRKHGTPKRLAEAPETLIAENEDEEDA